MDSFKTRLLNWLIALDQFLFCTATLGSSWPGETASSAAYRLEVRGRWQGRLARPVIDFLFRWDSPRHCEQAYFDEQRHLRQPEEQRGAT